MYVEEAQRRIAKRIRRRATGGGLGLALSPSRERERHSGHALQRATHAAQLIARTNERLLGQRRTRKSVGELAQLRVAEPLVGDAQIRLQARKPARAGDRKDLARLLEQPEQTNLVRGRAAAFGD